MTPLTRKTLLVFLIILTAASAGTMYGYYQKSDNNLAEPAALPIGNTAIPAPANSDITVYVTGEVNKPGVVTLPAASRVIDAISACNGVTDNADKDNINMAEPLQDGQQVTVPTKNTILPATAAAPPTNADSIIIPSAGNTANSTRNITGGKININTASEKELVELPGVGPSTAQKIIRYRQENGAFSTIDEIKNVRGIGDGKFAKMKDLIKT